MFAFCSQKTDLNIPDNVMLNKCFSKMWKKSVWKRISTLTLPNYIFTTNCTPLEITNLSHCWQFAQSILSICCIITWKLLFPLLQLPSSNGTASKRIKKCSICKVCDTMSSLSNANSFNQRFLEDSQCKNILWRRKELIKI